MEKEINLGRYKLTQELGKGAYGTVYRAYDETLRIEHAIKILKPIFMSDPVFVERFRQEAFIAARLDHPNIVPVNDMGQYENAFFLVMRLMEGGSLKDLLEKEGALPVDHALKVLDQIAAGLDFAHNHPEKLIHRDIKPGNILLEENGTARISDFGFSKALTGSSSVSLTGTGGVIGTPPYMAPELWTGKGASTQSDIYSLTCMFYEMLTGKILFKGDSAAEIMTQHVLQGPPPLNEGWPEEVPEALQAVIMRGLARELADRFQSGGALASEAREALITQPAQPLAPTQLYSRPEILEAPQEEVEEPAKPEPSSHETQISQSAEIFTSLQAVEREKPAAEKSPEAARPKPEPALPHSQVHEPAPKPEQQTPPAEEPKSGLFKGRSRKIIFGSVGILSVLCICVFASNLFFPIQVPTPEPIIAQVEEVVEEEAVEVVAEEPEEVVEEPEPEPTEKPLIEPTVGPPLGSSENPIIWGIVPFAGIQEVEEVLIAAEEISSLLADAGLTVSPLILDSNLKLLDLMCGGDIHMASMGTFNYLLANNQGCAEAILTEVRFGSPYFSGQIMTRVDKPIRNISDLAGKTFCRPDANSTSGWIVPRITMLANGLDPDIKLEIVESGGHSNTVTDIYNGVCDAGAAFTDARANIDDTFADVFNVVVVIQETAQIPNNSIVVHPEVGENERTEIANVVLFLGEQQSDEVPTETLFFTTLFDQTADKDFDQIRAELEASGIPIEELITP